MNGRLIMQALATVAAIAAAYPYYRDALTSPSFTRPSYRVAALLVIFGVLLLILCAIWL
jgi:uncharacterized membrane protein required for colicin V production